MENDCVTKAESGLPRRFDPPFPVQQQEQRMMQAKAARPIWIKPLDKQTNRKFSICENI